MTQATKEELFDKLKTHILVLKNEGNDFEKNPETKEQWLQNNQEITNALKALNSCDLVWLNDEYGKWADIEIKPYITIKTDWT